MPDPDAFLDPFCVASAIGGGTDLPIGLCVTDSARRKGIDLTRAALTAHDACNGGFRVGSKELNQLRHGVTLREGIGIEEKEEAAKGCLHPSVVCCAKAGVIWPQTANSKP